MTAPIITNIDLQQLSAVSRLEGLREFGNEQINKILDDITDTSYQCNVGLTARERMCRACNELQALKDIPREARLGDIVQRTRQAFGLVHMLHGGPREEITRIIDELHSTHWQYGIADKLRLRTRFVAVNTAPEHKASAAQIVAELIVIGSNAEDESFLADLGKAIEDITDIVLNWF